MEASTALNKIYNLSSVEEANHSNNAWTLLDSNLTSNASSNSSGWNVTASFSYTMFSVNCFFFTIGIFGNILIMLIVMRSQNRCSPYNLLVVSLAICDMLSLATNTMNQVILLKIATIDIWALIIDSGCNFFMSVQQTVLFMSFSIIMLICIERFIVVVFPLKAKFILSRKVTIISLCIFGILVLLVSVVPSVLYSQVNDGRCRLNVNSDENISAQPVRVVAYGVVIILPLLVIGILSPIIVYKLNKQRAIRARLTSKERGIGTFGTSLMLMIVVLIYIILVGIPTTVFIIFQLDQYDTDTKSAIIAKVCVATCYQVNNSTNFLVYGVSNVQFRVQLLRMFGCPCKHENNQEVENHAKPGRNANTIQMQNISG